MVIYEHLFIINNLFLLGDMVLSFLYEPQVLASVILIFSYAILFSEKLNRAVVVMLGAVVMILLNVLSFEVALKGVDFNKISDITTINFFNLFKKIKQDKRSDE